MQTLRCVSLVAAVLTATGCDRFSKSTRSISAPSPAVRKSSQVPSPVIEPEEDLAEQNAKVLQGVWKIGRLEYRGERQPITPALAINGNRIQRRWDIVERDNSFRFVGSGATTFSWEFILNATTSPAMIDLKCIDGEHAGKTYPGIYRLEGTSEGLRLSLAFKLLGQERPATFRTDNYSTTVLIVLIKEEDRPSFEPKSP